MFKGLRFWCGCAFGFFQTASKTVPTKNRTSKTVPFKILHSYIGFITVNLDEVGGYGFY